MKKKRILLLCIYLFVFITPVFSEPVSSIKHGAKNISLGHTGVSYYADVSSFFYNPALLLLNNRNTFSFEYSNNQNKLFNLLSLNYMRHFDKKVVMGFSFIYYRPPFEIMQTDGGEILKKTGKKTHLLNVGTGFKLNKQLNLGANFKFINNNYDEDYYNAISIDTGICYMPFKKLKDFSIGLNFMNLLSTTGELNNEEIKEQLNIKAGLSYRFAFNKHYFLLACDYNSEKDYFPQYGFGLEYNFNNLFSVRLGYNEDTEFTIGTGFKIESFDLNYTYEKQNDDIINHRISLSYYFQLELNAEIKERYYNKGIMYYNDFNFKKSYKYFEMLYKSDRYYRETEYYYELLYNRIQKEEKLNKERLAAAEELYQKAILFYKQEDNTKAMNKLIECLKKDKNHQDAKKLLNRIRFIETARVNKEKAKVREKEGDYYFLLSNFPAALLEYEEARMLDPDNENIKDKIKDTKHKLEGLDTESMSLRLYKQGMKLYKKGEYNKAIAKWKEALVIYPDFVKLKQQIQKATELIEKIKENRLISKVIKDKIKNLIKVIKYKYKNGNYSSALFNTEELLEISPNHAEGKRLKRKIISKIVSEKTMNKQKRKWQEKIHFNKGISLYKTGKMDQALYHLAKVVSLNPKKGRAIKELSYILRKMSKFEASGITKDSSNYKLITQHYNRGMKYYKKNDFSAAALEWKRVLKIVPGHIEIQDKLANAEEKAKKEKEEKLAVFHLQRANKFLKENKKSLALAEAKRILAVIPGHRKAEKIVKRCMRGSDKEKAIKKHIAKAEEFADDDKFQEAIQELKMVLLLESDNKTAHKKLSEYEAELKKIENENIVQDNLDKAYKYFFNNNFSDAKYLAKKVLKVDRNNKKAKRLLEQIDEKEADTDLTKLEKKKIIELYNQGVSYYLDEKYNKCINSMKKVISRQPDNMRAHKFIKKAKQKIKEKSSKRIVKKGKKIDKKLVWQYYLKGINYYTAGDIKNAIKEWQHALQLDPENKKIKQSLNRAYAKKAVLE